MDISVFFMVKTKSKNNAKTSKRSLVKGVTNLFRNEGSRKALSYTSNFVAGIEPVRYIAGKSLESMGSSAGYEIGNPVGAIIYGGLDLIKSVYPGASSSKYVRLLESAGAVYYGLSVVADLFGVLNGDFGQLAKLPLDVAMLYETGTNTAKDYKKENSKIRNDLSEVKSDVKYGVDWVRGLFGKKDSGLEDKVETADVPSSEDNFKKKRKIKNSSLEDNSKSSNGFYHGVITSPDFEESIGEMGYEGDDQNVNPNLESKPSEVFYLSTPNKDGSFNVSSIRDSFKYGASIYQFTKTSRNRARFRIDSNEGAIKLALAFPDSNIEPSCELQNAYRKNSSTIITEEEGEAELKGNKWRVIKPVKIRYE